MTCFFRTTNKNHYTGSRHLWRKLRESGDLCKRVYKGLYCVGCESYKTEKELDTEGKCPDHPTRNIETIEEENYFFNLSKYNDQIFELIKSDEFKIVPEIRKNEVLSFLKLGATDVSFSRPVKSLPWGVPVPEDEDHVMYVWCDALSNYITGQGYGSVDPEEQQSFKTVWPADIQVIGKDITRFHAVFWPAMLLSAGIPLPKELFVHGFLQLGGKKMGKSTGNVVEPIGQLKLFGVDGFRFYILGAMTLDADGDYNTEAVIERINSELVNSFSNFCYRTLNLTAKSLGSTIGKVNKAEPLIQEITQKFQNVTSYFEKRSLKQALTEVLEISFLGNKYLQEKAPWTFPENAPEALAFSVNLVKNLAILAHPFMPTLAENLQKQLNLSLDELLWRNLNFDLEDHKVTDKPEILVKRIQKEKEVQQENPKGKDDILKKKCKGSQGK